MQNNSQPINFYAALAIGIIVTIIISVVVFVAGLIVAGLSNTINGTNDWAPLVATATILVMVMLFFGLTTLLTSRYGWKTIIMTLIFQSIFLFGAAAAIAAIVGPASTSSTPIPLNNNRIQ